MAPTTSVFCMVKEDRSQGNNGTPPRRLFIFDGSVARPRQVKEALQP